MPTRRFSSDPQTDFKERKKLCKVSQCFDSRIKTMHNRNYPASWHRHVFFQSYEALPSRVVLLKLNTDIVVTPKLFNFLLAALKTPLDPGVLANIEKLDAYFTPREDGKHLREYELSKSEREEYYTYTSNLASTNSTLNTEVDNFIRFSKRRGISFARDSSSVGFSFAAKRPDVLNLELKFIDADAMLQPFQTGRHRQRAATLNVHIVLAKPGDRRVADTLESLNQQLAFRMHQFSQSFCNGGHYAALALEPDLSIFSRNFFSQHNERFQENTYSFVRTTASRKSSILPVVTPLFFAPAPTPTASEIKYESDFPALRK